MRTPTPSITDGARSPPRTSWRRPSWPSPFHLLDCATTSEGGCAFVLVPACGRGTWEPSVPRGILGCGSDSYGPAYTVAPVWDLTGRAGTGSAGWVGARAAQASFAMAGLSPSDVDVAEFYDPFSFEIIRQLEAYGFCEPGEGGPMVESGAVGPGGSLPVTTDGAPAAVQPSRGGGQQAPARVLAVQQIRGECTSMQVGGVRGRSCAWNGGSGALFADVVLLGKERPHEASIPVPWANPAGLPAATRRSPAPTVAALRTVLAGLPRGSSRPALLRGLRIPSLARLRGVSAVPRHGTRLGRECGPRLALQLDRGLATTTPLPLSSHTLARIVAPPRRGGGS